jgi:hypothetical protein
VCQPIAPGEIDFEYPHPPVSAGDTDPGRTCGKCNPCPILGRFNVKVEWGHDHAGCLKRTGSKLHWHFDTYNQNPDTCFCHLKTHIFGGCGYPPAGPGF